MSTAFRHAEFGQLFEIPSMSRTRYDLPDGATIFGERGDARCAASKHHSSEELECSSYRRRSFLCWACRERQPMPTPFQHRSALNRYFLDLGTLKRRRKNQGSIYPEWINDLLDAMTGMMEGDEEPTVAVPKPRIRQLFWRNSTTSCAIVEVSNWMHGQPL